MQSFRKHEGVVVPLDRANVDTDQIIPKQFLKSVKRTGFGENLFDAWRFLDEGEIGKTERQENPRFVLNYTRYRDATILLARRNFGCGSSREHAVWALMQYGIRCVIAPSFADIFYNNCINNGLLPVALLEEQVAKIFVAASTSEPLIARVDLENKLVSYANAGSMSFSIDSGSRTRLLEGMDEIGLTLRETDKIRNFEQQHQRTMPWLFTESP